MTVENAFARLERARKFLAKGDSNRGHQAREILLPLVDAFQSLLHLSEVFALIGESYFIEQNWQSASFWLERAVAAGNSRNPSRRHKRLLADAHVALKQFEKATHYLQQILDEVGSSEGECSCCPRRP